MMRGEVYLVNLSPSVGTEMRNPHYCVIVQSDLLEHDRRPRTIVVPITSREPKHILPYVIRIHPPEGGLKHLSYALCDQVTRIDKARILKQNGKPLSEGLIKAIEDALRLALDL